MAPGNRRLAVLGLGAVGRSWLRAFTRAGFETQAWDPDPDLAQEAWDWLKAELKKVRKRQGLRKAVIRSQRELVTRCETLEQALDGVVYAQEATDVSDLRQVKRLFGDFDAAAAEKTILASGSSRHDLDQVTAELPGRERCVITHPVALPHVIHTVEVCPGSATAPATVRRTLRILARMGFRTIRCRAFQPGLIADRLRAAVLREAVAAITSGHASFDAVEDAVRYGLGPLWAIEGPLATADSDAPDGLGTYLREHAGALRALWRDLAGTADLGDEGLGTLAEGLAHLTTVPRAERIAWRDDLVERLHRLKANHLLEGPVMD